MSFTLMRNWRRTTLVGQQLRFESTLTNVTQEDYLFRPPFAKWTKVIKEAEKIVGYPTSFMNLRWLLSDEFANMAMHLRKVVGSNHPVLQTAKSIIYNEHNNLQPWGLMILLLSKALKSKSNMSQGNGILENQRIIAEITEMIRTGHYVHRGLLNIPPEERDKDTDTAMFGNKIAILIGDYLLVTANRMLADMKNQDISYLISTALRDISEGEFFGDRDKQNMPLPGDPKTMKNIVDEFQICFDTLPLEVVDTLGSPIREWTLRTLFSGGSLFGRGCQGAVLLGGHGLEEQENAYFFGCHLCLAWHASSELAKITSDKETVYSLVSAPVLFALNENPSLYSIIQNSKDDTTDLNLNQLKLGVLETDAVGRTKLLYEVNLKKALHYIEKFGDNDSIDTIKRLSATL